jgi:hypothetical protein
MSWPVLPLALCAIEEKDCGTAPPGPCASKYSTLTYSLVLARVWAPIQKLLVPRGTVTISLTFFGRLLRFDI